MKYLLDTHTLIWYFEDDGKLPRNVENIIDNPVNTIFVSSATLWEIAIKVGLGKLDVDFDDLLVQVEQAEFTVVQIENAYLREIITLPQVHKDPFDRLLIATAKIEKMAVVTTDENIHKYDVDLLW